MMSSIQAPTRRKPPAQRRAEILETASAIALAEGLEQVTARRVADRLGVYPGLIHHYFRSAAELVAAAFCHAAAGERDFVYARARRAADPLQGMREVLHGWLDAERDAVSLLWLDAWQASRRRPLLLDAVTDQMAVDLSRLSELISSGSAAGHFHVDDPTAAAMRILALIDGLSVQAAVRASLDYGAVRGMVITTTQQILGLGAGALAEAPPPSAEEPPPPLRRAAQA